MDNFFFLFRQNHQQEPTFCFTHPFPAAPNLHLEEEFFYLPIPDTFHVPCSSPIEVGSSGPLTTSGALTQFQATQGRGEGQISSSRRKAIIENLQISSAKKNSQHNLSSQFCSFFKSISRSGTVVKKTLKVLQIQDNEKIRRIIYLSAKIIIDKKKRKYISLGSLRQLGDPLFYKAELPELFAAFQDFQDFTLLDFCRVFSRIFFYYFREVSALAILTSKRLKSGARKTHLQKERTIVERLQR